jgi:hypothetical protein
MLLRPLCGLRGCRTDVAAGPGASCDLHVEVELELVLRGWQVVAGGGNRALTCGNVPSVRWPVVAVGGCGDESLTNH